MRYKRKKLTACILVSLMAVISAPPAARVALAAEESYIVGRILGAVQPRPSVFRANMFLENRRIYPEVRFFRIVNSETDNFKIVLADGTV